MSKTQNFVIWLQGFLDANGEGDLDADKTKLVKEKLDGLFKYEAKDKSNPAPPKQPQPTTEVL
jgi:hypothetical protein